MKTLTQQFNSLNKKYIAIDSKMNEAAKKGNEEFYYNLSLELEIIQNKMSEISAKIEENE